MGVDLNVRLSKVVVLSSAKRDHLKMHTRRFWPSLSDYPAH